jgi:hypothetical protein
MTEHTILVAFTVKADSREQAEQQLHGMLPRPWTNISLTSWWVAEDDRRDGSDCDSAVFVNPGEQKKAFAVLHALGITPAHNNPERSS